jgi:hypothetical protein
MKNYALFSVSGRFIGFTNFKPVNGLYKEMPDNFDPVMQVYVGDYKSGQLKNIKDLKTTDYREANLDKKWKVFESDLNKELEKVIVKDYKLPIYKQINAIMDVLHKNKDKIELTPEFEEIYKLITELRHNHKNSLKVYQEAPKAQYVSKEEEPYFIEDYTQRHLNIKEEMLPRDSETK